MNKITKIVMMSVMTLGLSTASFAQEEIDYSAGYNFISVQGGAQATLTHFKFTDLVTPQFAVSAGRYFNDKVGFRLHVQGWKINSGFKADRYAFLAADQKYKFNDVTGDLDLLLNLSNIISPNRMNHTFNWFFVAGFGVNYTWGTDEFNKITNMSNAGNYYVGQTLTSDKAPSFNGRFGTGVEINVAKNLSISFEADANYKNDKFNYKFNDHVDWQIAAFLGLNFKFGVKTKKAPEPEPAPYVAPESKPEPKVEVKPEPKPQPVVVKQDKPLSETIYFKIRESDVNDDAVITKIANWCNEYPSKSITVSGYADKGTGTAEINKKYAEQRAFKVADAIKAKGVSADRINIQSFGDTIQPFADNDSNRCVIVIGE